MTTVATLLNALRYDLRNYGDVDYDIDQVIHYLNRAINILDARLVNFNSDQTLTTAVVNGTTGYDYITCPTRTLAVREVWHKQYRIANRDQQEVYYRRQFKKYIMVEDDSIVVDNALKTIAQNTIDFSAKGAGDNNVDTYWICDSAFTMGADDQVWKFSQQIPNYWAHVGNEIHFEAANSADLVYRVIYDQSTADLTDGSDMPYNGVYDDAIREVLVQMLIHKKHKVDSQTDAVYVVIFDQVLTMDLVNRKFWRKQYRLDF